MPNKNINIGSEVISSSKPSTATSTAKPGTTPSAMDIMKRQAQMTEKDLMFRDIPEGFKRSLTFGGKEYEPLDDIFKSALSNEYTSALKANGTTGGFVVEKWGELESTAKELYDHVKTSSEKRFWTEEEKKAYGQKTFDLKTKFNELKYDAENSLYLDEDGNTRGTPLLYFDKDTDYKLVNQSDFDKVSLKPVIRRAVDPNESAQDIQFEDTWKLSFGIPGFTEGYKSTSLVGLNKEREITTPEDAAYKQFIVNEESPSEILNKEIKPILNTWITSSFDLIDKPADAEWTEGKVTANKYNLVGLADTIAGMGAKSSNAAIKKEAQSILVGIERARAMNPNSQNDGIIKYLRGKKESLEKISNSLVGSHSIEAYNSFKNSYFLPNYWENPKEQSKARNVIDKYIRVREETLDASEKYRSAVIETMGNDVKSNLDPVSAELKQMVFDNMFTKTNRLKSEKALADDLIKMYGTHYKYSREKITSIGLAEVDYGSNIEKPTKALYIGKFQASDIARIYGDLHRQFKKQFADANVSNAMKNSGMVYGMTYNKSQFVGWNSVDMGRDYVKRNTVNQVTSIVNDSFNVHKNTGSGSVYVNKGGYVANATISEVKGDKTEASMKKIYDDFFNKLKTKDGNILPFDVDFSPVSNLENKALYIFRAKLPGQEKQEQISVYVDKSLPQLKEEELFKNTQTEPADWSFKLDGEWDLNHLRTEGVKPGTDVKIKLDKKNNMKYLHAHLWNAEKNMFVEVKRPLTDINMSRILDNEKDIQKMLEQFAESYRHSKNQQ